MFVNPEVRVRWLRNFTSTVHGNVMAGTTKLIKIADAEKLQKMQYAEIIEQSQPVTVEPEKIEDAPRVKRSNIKRSQAAPEGNLE